MTIVAIVLLALLGLVGSSTFFLMVKKQRFRESFMGNRDAVVEFVRKANAHKSFEERTRHIGPLHGSYVYNLNLLLGAELNADQKIKVTGGVIAVSSMISSFFFGSAAVLVLVGAEALGALTPLGDSGRRSAFINVLEIAQIIYLWQKEAPEECQEIVYQSRPMWRIYEVVRSVTGHD